MGIPRRSLQRRVSQQRYRCRHRDKVVALKDIEPKVELGMTQLAP